MAKGNPQRFSSDIVTTTQLHISSIENIRAVLFSPSLSTEAKEIIEGQKDDIQIQLTEIQSAYTRFIQKLVGQPMKDEVEKQISELFPDEINIQPQETEFIKTKIIYEHLASFLKASETAWNNIMGMSKVFSTYPSTKPLYEKIQRENFLNLNLLNEDTRALLNLIEKNFECYIVGPSKSDKRLLVSNLIYDEGKDYKFENLFKGMPKLETIVPTQAAAPTKLSDRLNILKSKTTSTQESDYYFTSIRGTKEWNRNDAYILFVKKNELKEEEKKFYSSSFVILNPSDNNNINLAAALVRKNMGHSAAPKYNKMLQTLVDFAVTNLFTKDFVDLCDDTHTFLYHIGPIVIYNIIQEDLVRRDFGYCHYVENNKIIKFLPEAIIKKHIIDYWAEKFFDLKSAQVDAYINYSKGVSNIRESYRTFFENAASTRKRITNDPMTTEDYMRENVGKFFGYRRAQVYRRFVPDNVFGLMSEINSTELVTKFKFR
ncbi:MAG TPA: hypothetical protein PK079_13970 [Leptospiraceae bacterium]|nr:hypothetical protein [Leptospiraceae bacterium]HMW08197.1 hypothetical protein [Leptospiraceae bacterium]HMX33347.1 hypothetical protein [Leptospiraceae bacterium]HMY34092.1 hypothetical protein [Leptospiraceae bacterium]HMZ64609.1 hypothetical protein [Leptospiraceae bacterium]